MNSALETVKSIKEIYNFQIGNRPFHTDRAQLGMVQMLNTLMGYSKYDGYEVETNLHSYKILIDNGQCCCEDWGYFASNDESFDRFIGKQLAGVYLTDTALNTKQVDELYLDQGEVQFVDFVFADGDKLQLAVYNSHNGYYGHPIFVLKDDAILKQDTL